MGNHEVYDSVTDPAKFSNLHEPVHPKLKDSYMIRTHLRLSM
jgi:hypothetical protein